MVSLNFFFTRRYPVRDEGRREKQNSEKQYNFTNFSKFNFQKNVEWFIFWVEMEMCWWFLYPDFWCFLGLSFVGAKNNNFTNFSKLNFQKDIKFLFCCWFLYPDFCCFLGLNFVGAKNMLLTRRVTAPIPEAVMPYKCWPKEVFPFPAIFDWTVLRGLLRTEFGFFISVNEKNKIKSFSQTILFFRYNIALSILN